MGGGTTAARFGIATLVAVLTALVPAAPSAARARPPCTRAGASTVVVKPGLRVYVYRGRIYGCLNRWNRHWLIDRPREEDAVPDTRTRTHLRRTLRVSGNLVAYAIPIAGDEDILVLVKNLRSGREGRVWETVDAHVGSPPVIWDVELKANGSFAWIWFSGGHGGGNVVQPIGEYVVQRYDRSGVRELDAGTNIARESLTLSGSTVRWIRGGALFSAPIS